MILPWDWASSVRGRRLNFLALLLRISPQWDPESFLTSQAYGLIYIVYKCPYWLFPCRGSVQRLWEEGLLPHSIQTEARYYYYWLSMVFYLAMGTLRIVEYKTTGIWHDFVPESVGFIPWWEIWILLQWHHLRRSWLYISWETSSSHVLLISQCVKFL